MQQNNNTSQDSSTLSEATNTRAGTAEQGALKTIHRSYNKLNGYEAMLHIIQKYRVVLYPFIVLSVLGSAYSFYMDYTKVFPFMPEWLKITKALFFSIMLEIVRDGSIIAIFNSKMKLPSRVLVIIIFFGVTTYLFNTHIKTKNIIEQSAIEYALLHQDEKAISAKNPKYETAVQELDELKEDLTRKKLEITDTLIANTTSIYKAKRTSAISQKANIEAEVKSIKAEITQKRGEINSYKQENITSIEESQKLISSVLLTTLILIETLAMLGAVIKFINKDNADKEVAKHSEIIEQYEDMSEQMRKTNDDLGLMLSRDIEQSGKQNLAFVSAMAQNREMFQSQMNEVLNMFAQTQTFSFNQPMFNQVQQPQFTQPTQQVAQEPQPQPTKAPQMGFIKDQETVDDLEKRLSLKRVFTGSNNNGSIFAYLYKGYLIQNNKEAIITQPKKGQIQQKENLYWGMYFIEPSKYNKNHKPLYKGKQTELYRLIDIVDSWDSSSGMESQQRTIGFAIKNRDDLINKIFKDVEGKGEKLPPKPTLVNIKNRTETKIYETTMRELKDIGVVNYKVGQGYFLAVGKESAMHILHEDETPFKERG